MNKMIALLTCIALAGCSVQVAGGGSIDRELYARVFNQCVKDAGPDHAFYQDVIYACKEAALNIASTTAKPSTAKADQP